jgi:methionine-rich copper-binding protein CopC
MRSSWIAMVLAAGVAVCAGPVLAHATFSKAEPAPGSTLKKAPQVVRLVFNIAGTEELDPRLSAISVWDSRGRRVDDGKGGVDLQDLDRRTLVARLKPIGPGTYTVRWKAVSSEDKDVAQGSYKFIVSRP